MAARLGIIGQTGLGEALRSEFSGPFGRVLTALLVLSAIAIGNAAYETGNLLGGTLGLSKLSGISEISIASYRLNFWGPVIGILAFILLLIGNYRVIEKFLVALVIFMSVTFITTAILVKPALAEVLKGLFIPRIPETSVFTLVGLIGTTVVPYNLFLHASAVGEKWKNKEDLRKARADSIVSIGAGGIISMTIVITSAAAFFGTDAVLNDAGDMAVQLQPLLGDYAGIILSAGLLAAGISSAITAPLAAAYACAGILGWKKDLKDRRFRAVWMVILFTGICLSSLGFKPVQAIMFAQVTNGVLLPLIAVFLLKVMNSKRLLGDYTNSLAANIAGIIVVVITLILGLRSIFVVTGLI
jgi:Mn2+/Fe2+ NRAMP family transporter